MQTLPEDHPLNGPVSDDIVPTGHSFGGYTTFAAVGLNMRWSVGVPNALTRPVMVFARFVEEEALSKWDLGSADRCGCAYGPG